MKALAVAMATWLSLMPAISGCRQSNIHVDARLPDLTFTDMAGNPVRIQSFLEPGKLLLIHFWGAACCRTYSGQTLEAIAELRQSKKFDHVTMVSVNLDDPETKVRRIMKDYRMVHPVLNDPDNAFYQWEPRLKNTFPLALFVVADENGIIRKKMTGPQLGPSIADLLIRPEM